MYPEIDFLYLNEEDMIKAGVKDMSACIDTMEEVLKCTATGDYVMAGENHSSHGAMVKFPKEPKFKNMPKDEGDDRRFMAMPAYIGGPFDLCGMKWYGSNMSNKEKGLPRSILTLMLNDKVTGAPIALMSANVLSAMRTGAIPGVGMRCLVRKGATVAGIQGPGVMGKTGLAAIMSTCPDISTLKVRGRSKKSIDSFVEHVKETYASIKEIIVVDSDEELIRDSDVVYFAATSGTDASTYLNVKKEWVKKGACLIGVSAFNVDTAFLAEDCRLVVDYMGLYEAWAEEYPYPTFGKINIIGSKFTDMIHDGLINKDQVDDMGDILLGNKPGRTNDDEIFVYSIGGMPVEDVAWGKICYEKAKSLGIGKSLNLWNTPELA